MAARGLRLLPTPAVNDMGAHYTPDAWEAWTTQMKAAFDNGNGHGNSLSIEARKGGNTYAVAIGRWTRILGRPAPDLTTRGHLNPAFVEWMMGYPDGYVVKVPGINKSTAIRALGNACVPAQAEHAVRVLLARLRNKR